MSFGVARAEARCKRPGCCNPVLDSTINYCDECLTPNIEQEVKEYNDLRLKGYSKADAEMAVGWVISRTSPLGG